MCWFLLSTGFKITKKGDFKIDNYKSPENPSAISSLFFVQKRIPI